MIVKNKVKDSTNDRGSINPKDETFDFELWAREVRTQMIETLEKKVGSTSLTA